MEANDIKEIEVKLLNVNVDEVKRKLNDLCAQYSGECLQQMYTYDMCDSETRYTAILNEIGKTDMQVSIEKIKLLFNELSDVISIEDNERLKTLFDFSSLRELGNLIEEIEEFRAVLFSKELIEIIKNAQKNFFKWIRLRKTGDTIELTLKQIFSNQSVYNINDVKEIEIKVNSLEMANLFLEELGYVKRRYAEKKRTSYKLKDICIEIDEWPMIPPLLEIEGKNEKDVYDLAAALGFSFEECKPMNTEDVYKLYGINLEEYRELRFNH